MDKFVKMETLRYQRMNEERLKQVLEIFVKTFNTAPWNEQWTLETAYKRLFPLVSNQQGVGLVCYYKDKPCGFILGVSEQDYDGMVFTIREFCVDTTMQRKNIGTSLYQELERELVKRKVVAINLLTLKGELPEKFYQKQGFDSSNKILYMDKKIL